MLRKTLDNLPLSRPYLVVTAIAVLIFYPIWGLLELVRIDTLAYLLLPAGLITTAWALLGLARTLAFLPYALLLSLSLAIWADMVPALVDLASVVVGTWVGWRGWLITVLVAATLALIANWVRITILVVVAYETDTPPNDTGQRPFTY